MTSILREDDNEVIIVFSDASVSETDYRHDKLASFKSHLRRIIVDVKEPLLEDNIAENFVKDATPATKSVYGTFYIVTLCKNYKLLYATINVVMKAMEHFKTSVVFLEDLLWVERPYIITHESKRFLATIAKTAELFVGNVDVKIKSTNELLNVYGEGDCSVVRIEEFSVGTHYWDEIRSQVQFQQMYNRGSPVPRLVSIQSLRNADGNRPLYRHPNDIEPVNVDMDPIVRDILDVVERSTGVKGINHVLIQCYRDGSDNIQQHSDKTLDINRNTPILNVSFGSSRSMYIQNKTDKLKIEKIPLQNGECVLFGLATNRFWLHEVPKDVMMVADERFGKTRISFTFRRIDTFVDEVTDCVYGQGSRFKTVDELRANYTLLSGCIFSGTISAESGTTGAGAKQGSGSVCLSLTTGEKSVGGGAAATAAAGGDSETSAVASCDNDSIDSAKTASVSTASTAYRDDMNDKRGAIASETAVVRSDLIHAFHLENKQAHEFDWDTVYGAGFEMK